MYALLTPLRGIALIAFCCSAVGLCGCDPSGPKLMPVTGKVTLKNGSPVAYGHVILHADVSKGNQTKEVSQGTITDGVYVIKTGARDGAPPGAYRVTIEAAAEVDPKNPYITKWYADMKYTQLETSALALDVISAPEPARYDFKLDPAPPEPKGIIAPLPSNPPTAEGEPKKK